MPRVEAVCLLLLIIALSSWRAVNAHELGGDDVFLVSLIAKPLCLRTAPESRVAGIENDYRYFEGMYDDHLASLRAEGLDGKSFARLQEEFEARVSQLPAGEVIAECGKIVAVVDEFNKAITLASAAVADNCRKYFPGFDRAMDGWKRANRAFLQESEGDAFFSYFRKERAGLLTGTDGGTLKGECGRIYAYIAQHQ